MDLLLIGISFAAGWLLAGNQPSPPPPHCPPVEYPTPPPELMQPLPLDYLVPPEMRRQTSPPAKPSAPD